MKATYDITKSYEWNYENGPIFEGNLDEIKERVKKANKKKGKTKLLDFELNSGIGVPAGPLLNSNYIKLYAELGFDIPVYKTLRTLDYKVHPAPNCVYVKIKDQLERGNIGGQIEGSIERYPDISDITITNSFGMPSKNPKEWQEDIELANSYLSEGQVMVVSVVATPSQGDMVRDYAKAAKLAKEAGAKIIEANYSCPNVSSGEGSIYIDSEYSSKISREIKKEIGNTPLFIKVGYFGNKKLLEEVVKANNSYVQGIAGINTISMKVLDKNGKQALPGEGRLTSGLCGSAIKNLSREFIKDLKNIKKKEKYDFVICGVGGITEVEDIDKHIEAGGDIVMTATGAMWNPLLALEYKERQENLKKV